MQVVCLAFRPGTLSFSTSFRDHVVPPNTKIAISSLRRRAVVDVDVVILVLVLVVVVICS